MTNHYDTLGVNKSDSIDQIKDAYKKLAKKHHPDKGGDPDKFKRIQEAYEVVGDPAKRAEYDNPNPFSSMFDGGFPFSFPFPVNSQSQVHKVVTQQVYISLRDVYYSNPVKVKIQRHHRCNTCVKSCSVCSGKGVRLQMVNVGPFTQHTVVPCDSCRGEGYSASRTDTSCTVCANKRYVVEEMLYEFVPEIQQNRIEQRRISGWGKQAKDGSFGPLDIIPVIQDHDKFSRNGVDLRFKTRVTFSESVCGKKIPVPLFDDAFNIDTVKLGIIDPRRDYLIHSKGLPTQNGRGNLIIEFDIVYPKTPLATSDIEKLQALLPV